MRILAVQVNPTVGDIEGNFQKVVRAIQRARKKGIEVVVFPEMVLMGYPPEDLLLDNGLIEAIEKKLEKIEPLTRGLFVAVGLPRRNRLGKEKPLFNSAAIFIDGKLVGFKDKTLLPTYDVFDERRYFEPGKKEAVWKFQGKKIGVTICEDAWQHAHLLDGYTDYVKDPILKLKKMRPDLVLNLSGSPYYFNRKETRLKVFQKVAKTLRAPLVLCNQVGANDQLVFDGRSFFLDAKGELIQMAEGFVEEELLVDLAAKKASYKKKEDPIRDLYRALVLGVRDYFQKQGLKQALVGLSGGIDSALVLCIAKEALGAKNVVAITMPSRYSSKGSVADAHKLADKLGVEILTVSIEPVFQEYLSLLKPLFKKRASDITEENLQSRIREMILMAFSNKFGHILLSTSNKSEMAMGYSTLYGDMAGGLGVLQDVTKLQVYELANYIRVIPKSILTKAPSAELKENQTDLDTLPPFEILDPILEDYLEERLPVKEIAKRRKQSLKFVEAIVKKIHAAEYKRRQAPIGIRVTQKAFSKGRVIPIVQKWIV